VDIAVILYRHTFCVVWRNAQKAHASRPAGRCARAFPQANHTQQKDTSLQPPPPFRLCRYKTPEAT